MRRVVCAFIFVFMLSPSLPAAAVDLPKCRNVAGYEPKAVCQARNQRAEWQAQQTASITARLVANAMARQSEVDREREGDGFMGMVSGAFDSAVKAVSNLF